ncbi:DUF397 domain-containing protein [Streptomyces sp. AK02-01A]|uniref:DUF397 domain-containing protein n=1 Tax=Streptomyces sp. AK02-01A TaxID=3028648 RepID=UPI0029A48F85|nr:DUF397 domain-containing protein [Streptomyces sp. AK02-01A]MDX3851806.1 DUF397 domain-containing protein [Streptomyces sp. AK02-01A]
MTGIDWFKSSYSNAQGGECVEGARLSGGVMAVRDSKVPDGPAFVLAGGVWTAFLDALTGGKLDGPRS